jgi:PAS domain-containing protein
MNLIDKLSRRIGERAVEKRNIKIDEVIVCGITDEINELESLREELVEKDAELKKTRLMWDATFDSVPDNIVLIGVDKRIQKVNDSFYHCAEEKVGHIELVGMLWDDVRKLSKVSEENCTVNKCFDTGLRQELDVNIHHQVFHVTSHPIYSNRDGHNEFVGVVRVSRDITNREKGRFKLERRSKIYHAIADMSKTLMMHENWDNAINLILGDLGRAIGCNRVYMFKNEIRENRICATRQSVYSNDKHQICKTDCLTDCINYDLLPEWVSKMEHGLPVDGSLVECHICTEKNKCTYQDDVLVLAVPLFVDKKWWGFIGFDYTNGTRAWKDEDSTLLRIASDILGGVIYHRNRYWDSVSTIEDCEDQLKEK